MERVLDYDGPIDREGFDALTRWARTINPELPEDLTGHTVTISLSKDGPTAIATTN